MTLQDWLTQIEAEPDDWDTYQAFSDWLKENGMAVVGHAVWWMWRRRKHPKQQGRTGWFWGVEHSDRPNPPHLLPPTLLRRGTYSADRMWGAITWLAAQLDALRREYFAE